MCRACKITTIDDSVDVLLSSAKLEEAVILEKKRVIQSDNYKAENNILALINAERRSVAVAPLSSDKSLKDLAYDYVNKIIASSRFSHLDNNNNTPADRARSAGIIYTYIGENLAIASNVNEAHLALMESVSHRENILSAKFKKVGVSILSIENDGIILVEEFTD